MMTMSSTPLSHASGSATRVQLFQAHLALDATPHSSVVVNSLHRYLDHGRSTCKFLYVLPPKPDETRSFAALDDEVRQETARVVNQQFDQYAQVLAGNGMVAADRQFVEAAQTIEEGMLHYLDTHPSDLLILGMHDTRPRHRGWRIDSTSYAIASHAPGSVMVLKQSIPADQRLKVFFTTDGSQQAQKAAEQLTRFLPRAQTDIVLFSVVSVNYYVLPVVEPYVDYAPLERALTGEAGEMLDKTRHIFESAGYTVDQTYFTIGDPVDQILTEAEKQHTDLLVMGARRMQSDVTRWLLGSTSTKVLEYSGCSVAILR
jgi:nucleotide-binding universal stress UspA family protein